MNFSSRRRSVFTLVTVLGTLLVGGAIYSRTRAAQSREISDIAPGVSLLAVSTQTANGPLRYWLVKAEKSAARMAIEVADARDVSKKRPVRELASQSGALVAINGGFFAYEGAAVGAVKVDGEWHRLPWKSRTALMWNQDRAIIHAIFGQCNLQLPPIDARFVTKAALNGFTLPGTHDILTNGFAVLTPRYAGKYTVSATESALIVRQNRVAQRDVKGKIVIPEDGFLLVARGNSRSALDAPKSALIVGAPLRFFVGLGPIEANDFPNILGAGPLLVQNGEVKTTEIEEEFRPDVIERGPRTAVGFDANGNTLFLVADGRQAASVGLTIPETGQLFRQLGAVQAVNLDGGSSTQLVVRGELINAPSGYDPVNPLRAREVRVSNALVLQTKR